ncbi:MAG: gas vesicle protein K [Streptosporangiaceae bacterium]|nr:gas vesicle protein K [Streptosporangiaceae bacterium]
MVRIEADPDSVEKGLVSLVLTLVELLRQLMERQALRRMEQGSLTEDQIEKVGATLMALEDRMAELRDHFGLTVEDLNLDLGPLGPLLPREGGTTAVRSKDSLSRTAGCYGASLWAPSGWESSALGG